MTGADHELRAGLVGFGLAGEVFHAPLIAATPGLRLAGVVTSDPERQSRARARYPGARVLGSAEALLARSEELDLIVVATPNRTHVALAKAALDTGLAVVVDKPLAPTAVEGRHLADRARRSGLLLTVFQNRRWDGDFRTLRKLVKGGALGEVLRFESRFERWRPRPKEGWRQSGAPGEAGGLLFDLGSHLVDQAFLLFGPVSDVYAELAPGYPGAEVDNDTFVALEHESGTRSHLWMSSLAARPGARFRVLGTRAGWVKHGLDGQEAALKSGRKPDEPGWGEEPREAWGSLGAGDDIEPVATVRGNYLRFYEELVRAIREGGVPPVPPDEAVAVLEILEAAKRAASPT